MSKALVPSNINIPAHLANRLNTASNLASSIGAGLGSGGGFPRISLKGSRFRVMEGGTESVIPELTLDVVIVGANPALAKVFYNKEWSKDEEPTSPDCQSSDGIRPDADSPHPQADSCAGCKHNQWGSKIAQNGQKLKACADQKRLAVVAADDPGGPIYQLLVKPASLKGLNQYHKELQRLGIPAEIVCTKLSFDTEASFPKLDFSFSRLLSENELEVVDSLFGSPQVYEVTGEKPQTATVVSIAKPMLIAPKVEPVKVVEVKEEPAPPATPKRGFGAVKEAVAKEEPAPAKRGFKKEPSAAPVVEAGEDLTSRIAELLGSMNDDAEAE